MIALLSSLHQTSRYNEFVCFMIYFLVALDALIVVPFSSAMAITAGASASQAGYLTSAYALAAAITSLIIKGSTNPWDEKKKIGCGLIGIAVVTLGTSVLNDFYWLLVARVLTGMFGGALAVITLNYLILISGEERKKKNTAILLSAFPLALAVGVPSLIMLSSTSSWQFGFQLLGLALVVVLCLFLVSLFASSKSLIAPIPKPSHQPSITEAVTNYKELLIAIALIFTAILSTFVVSTQYPVMLLVNLNIPPSLLSFSYALSGLGSFIAVQSYARTSVSDLTISRLIGALSLTMAIAVGVGFHTLSINAAALAFITFIIVSSTRTLILITELISTLTPQTRTKVIRLQSALQHCAVGLGGALGSVLVTTQPDSTLDFTKMIYAAVTLILCVPLLWQLKGYDKNR